MLIEPLSLDITAEALRANNDWKSASFKVMGHFRPDFHVEWDVLANYFCKDR